MAKQSVQPLKSKPPASPKLEPKPYNPARCRMSKEEAVEENRKLRERRAKLKAYQKELEAEDTGVKETPPEVPVEEPKKRGRKKQSEVEE